MTDENIICFAKDWNSDPTSCNHVLRELAKNNKVLWINSISTRSPSFTNKRDLGKIFRHLRGFLKGAKPVGDKMWLFTPFVLPFHHKPWAVKVNQQILRLSLGILRRQLKMSHFQLWTFVPTAAEYIGTLGEELVVYYCTDEWSQFNSVDGQRINEMVRTVATKADVVFATSRPLVEKLVKFNPETNLASHGVKYSLFATALQDETKIPADMSSLKGPILGFYGLVEDWLDLDLIAHLAEHHPEWTIVLVGNVCVDVSRLEKFTNIHFLGRKPHDELPAYCKGFNVALIPHKVNELTRNMNPIKLREYLSAGLPIVSTALPEMKNYPEHCYVAESYADFEAGIVKALEDDSPDSRKKRSAAMANETWDGKVAKIGETILKVKAKTKSART
ncbi:glycosyltransferase [Armatimonas rosea]|uniref:Glycosyltransferase involved in cell wall biosynthesis n=1 Tax=Armatimonas rosea TaxID=685828 RepID=A0A7W9SLJ0_ARMRO|nr:glycosyltransferase [Armatimonas rosea]MBB6048877.1 glycosyltransferase involved in cell wall biosynthesis [Armatimonas rosea]